MPEEPPVNATVYTVVASVVHFMWNEPWLMLRTIGRLVVLFYIAPVTKGCPSRIR